MSRDDGQDFNMEDETSERELAVLGQALREARPAPDPGFTERLDRAVADHFPPEWADEAALGRRGKGGIGNVAERFRRRLGGRRILLPAMAGFAGLLVVATVIVTATETGPFGHRGGESETAIGTQAIPTPGAADVPTPVGPGATDSTAEEPTAGGPLMTEERLEASRQSADSAAAGPAAAVDAGPALEGAAAGLAPGGRDVARSTKIRLGTNPEGVQDVANEVVAVTDAHNGIVMDSRVTDGEEGAGGASFSLLIPSGRLEAAVAELSGIADLRSRSQELTDITAPVTRAEDAVATSKAKIESLLGELEEAADEDERAEIEQRIRWERSALRWHQTRLSRLERRIDYTPVAVSVETSGDRASDDDSAWGLTDAVDDAGRLLGVAAGVTVLALAVAIPIGLVVLIALALNRAWVRRSRRRVLADDD